MLKTIPYEEIYSLMKRGQLFSVVQWHSDDNNDDSKLSYTIHIEQYNHFHSFSMTQEEFTNFINCVKTEV
jgi:hypothetical protein